MTKEPLCGGRAVGTGQEEIVDRGEGLEFARAEPVETMMAQRELAIRSGHKPGQGLQGDGAPQRRGLEGGPPDVVGAYARDIVKSGVWPEIKRRPAVGLTRCCHRPEYHR